MPEKSAYVRCGTCGVINKFPADRLAGNPKCGKCGNHLEIPAKPLDVTTAAFEKEVLAWPGNVLVEFWTPWCGYCRVMGPLVENLAREKAGILRVVKVNLDNEPFLGARFSINATPTFYFYRHGVRLADIAGAVPKEQFEAWVDAALSAE